MNVGLGFGWRRMVSSVATESMTLTSRCKRLPRHAFTLEAFQGEGQERPGQDIIDGQYVADSAIAIVPFRSAGRGCSCCVNDKCHIIHF